VARVGRARLISGVGQASETAVARWHWSEPHNHTDAAKRTIERQGVSFYVALLIMVGGIALALFFILFFRAVLMLLSGA
jgi:hypothetical protein